MSWSFWYGVLLSTFVRQVFFQIVLSPFLHSYPKVTLKGSLSEKRTNVPELPLVLPLGFYYNPDHGSFIQYPIRHWMRKYVTLISRRVIYMPERSNTLEQIVERFVSRTRFKVDKSAVIYPGDKHFRKDIKESSQCDYCRENRKPTINFIYYGL